MRLHRLQMLAARDEGDVLARSGQLRSEVTARTTCSVDRYAHQPFADIAGRVCYDAYLWATNLTGDSPALLPNFRNSTRDIDPFRAPPGFAGARLPSRIIPMP